MLDARKRQQPQVAWLAMVGLAVASGCQSPLKPPSKQHAEQRWNQVRGRTKLQIAQQQADRGLFDEALATASEALAMDPGQPDAYVLAAKAQLELGNLASAERTIQAAHAAGIQSADLTYLSGVVWEQRGDIDQALDQYRQAHALDPKQVDYLAAEAECLVSLGRPDAALSLLEESIHSFDQDATVAALAARTALFLNKTEAAIRWYRIASARLPDNRVLAEELGLLLARSGRCDEAVPLLRPLVDANRQALGGGPCRALAACYLTADDPISAGAVLTAHLADHPDDAAAQLLAAQSAIALGDVLTAARALHHAELHGAPRSTTLFLRGVLEWRRGKPSQASVALEQALSLDPTNPEASSLLGVVRAELGDREGAAEAFERALYLSPANPLARHGLASLLLLPEPSTGGEPAAADKTLSSAGL